MKIGTKQMAGFLGLAAMLAAVGGLGYVSINTINAKITEVLEATPLIDASMEMVVSLEGDRKNVLKLIHAANSEELEQGYRAHETTAKWFEQFAGAIIHGAETDMGTIYAVKDDSLKKNVQTAEAFHKEEFQPAIDKIYKMAGRKIELAQEVEMNMEQFEVDFDAIVEKTEEFEGRIKSVITDKLQRGVSAGKIMSAENTWADMAMEIKATISMTRIRIEEYAQNLGAGSLNEILGEYESTIKEFDLWINALLNGAKTPEGNIAKVTDPELRRLVVEIHEMHGKSLQVSARKFIEAQNSFGDLTVEQNKLATKVENIATEMQELLEHLEDGVHKTILAVKKSADTTVSRASSQVIGMVVFGLLLAVTLGVLISRNITGLLHNLVGNLSNAADQLSSASDQISASCMQLSQGATEQAASLEETSSSIEEISGQTRENATNALNASKAMQSVACIVTKSAQNASEAAKLSSEAKSSAGSGVKAMGEITTAMKRIREGSDQITDIVEVISDITHQTKMLATNAAIEAARAGDQGKGFAVVADEVSKLAEHSKKAAKEIAELIKDSSKRAQLGSELAENGEGVLTEILDKSMKVADLVTEISRSSVEEEEKVTEVDRLMENIKTASDEQSTGIDQICRVVTDLDKVTQSNAANSEENASASEELSSQAKMLQSLVGEISLHVGTSSPESGKILSRKRFRGKRARDESPIATEGLVSSRIILPEDRSTEKRVGPEAVIPMRDDFKEF